MPAFTRRLIGVPASAAKAIEGALIGRSGRIG
jgi:hypothetical protein